MFIVKKNKSIILGVTCFFFLHACGFTGSDYVSYEEESTSAECDTAVTEFTNKIGTLVNETCAGTGCHGAATGAGSLKLQKSNTIFNEDALYKYAPNNASKIYDKISLKTPPTHSGGDYSSQMTLASIQSWMTLRASCK